MYNIRFQSNLDKRQGIKKESSQRRRCEQRNLTTVRDMRIITNTTTGAAAEASPRQVPDI